MAKYLVLTALGPDRTGSVSELTKLASKCGCNIIDSRMAIFGLEFTLIMLLHGSQNAINKLELQLPAVAHKLELITMMKRTSGHKKPDYTQHYKVSFAGIDQPGILKAVTAFFAQRSIDISSLKSVIDEEKKHMSASMLIALTDETSIDTLDIDFIELCQLIDVQGCIKKVNSNLLEGS